MDYVSFQSELLIVLSGYGQTGPYAGQAGYDVIIEAEAGLMHMYVLSHVRATQHSFPLKNSA